MLWKSCVIKNENKGGISTLIFFKLSIYLLFNRIKNIKKINKKEDSRFDYSIESGEKI